MGEKAGVSATPRLSVMLPYIEGRLQTRYWEDSQGNKKSTVEVVANEMLMLSERTSQEDPRQFKDSIEEQEDEFPF